MTNSTPSQCPRCGGPLRADAAEGLCPRCLAALPLATETELEGAPAAAPLLPLTPEELAPHFPQLDILECLGRGGMGVVYKARQKSLKRLVALKLLAPERAADQAFAARFAREAQALASLNHPNIVAVHDFGQAAGFYYLLMEYVDGVDLRWAMRGGRFTPEQALTIVPPVCEALQFAHEHGIVHRDIKPENLLLDRERRLKIVDFGIAKILGDDTSVGVEESQPAGTPQYMAPEQKAHRTTDHRADIYSLGVVLYEMLTGEHPKGKLEGPSKRVQLDVRIDEIVLRALEASPELRFQTAAEFRTQVETVASAMDRSPQITTAPAPAPLPRFSRTTMVASAWMVLFFAVVPAFIWHEIGTNEFAERGPFASPLTVFTFFTFVFPGFTSPFGTTVLAWIAVAKIRRSSGRLFGLGLAVFNGLLFPLLALDGAIAWFFYHFGQAIHVWPANWNDAQWSQFLLLSTITAAAVDFLLIRRVWRAVNVDASSHPPAAAGWRVLGWTAAAVCGVCATLYWPHFIPGSGTPNSIPSNQPNTKPNIP